MSELNIMGHKHEKPPSNHHHKCIYCKNDGEIYKNERSNANAIIINGCIMLNGNMKTTMFQALFTEIKFCPFCGRELKTE